MVSQFFHDCMFCVQCGCGVVASLAAMVAKELEALVMWRLLSNYNPLDYRTRTCRGYGRISGGLKVLELAANNQEASLGKGARYTSTGMLTSS
jgi:predicted nucleic acid-binding protein